MTVTLALILRVIAVIFVIIGIIFLAGLLFPRIFPSDALTSIAFTLAGYVLYQLGKE